MSELLDVFDDAQLLDRDTRLFLIEALENAEAADWRDILEPFVSPPELALDVLQKTPGVLQRSRKSGLGALGGQIWAMTYTTAIVRCRMGSQLSSSSWRWQRFCGLRAAT